MEFLNEAKVCVLNGRFNEQDNYTSISGRGKAVVDYICVPHDIFSRCKYFNVVTVQEITDQFALHGLLGERSRLPDHSVLLAEFECDISSTQVNLDAKQSSNDVRYKTKNIPPDFMSSEISRIALINIITRIESTRETQEDIDSIYTDFLTSITNEMSDKLPKYRSKSTAKRHKNAKPYWNEELQKSWDIMHQKEKSFLSFKGCNRTRMALRSEYISTRNSFDKLLRKSERDFRRAQALEIDDLNTNNPNEFWQKIQRLGPRRDKDIPMEVMDDNGDSNNDENVIFERWKNDFMNLYNRNDDGDFDETHYDRAKIHKVLLELGMQDPLYTPNEELNGNISIEEISKIVQQAKSGSACGLDKIPYEVLKFPPVIEVLRKLFQLIFDSSIIPSVWRRAIICPILKDSNSDNRIPLNYRGISLLSCVSKLYTSFLNKRLTNYLEDNNLLADEQNGFRANRSCEEHIFTLNSIIRNNKNVFTAFIDLKKCFDFIDRDMLLYKLLLHKVDGKMYNSISNIYAGLSACVRLNNKRTEWFDCLSGLKQGCNLSPTLFSIFANDLVQEINALDLGIQMGTVNISILMYADDIVLISNTEENLQVLLDTLHNWCKKWRVLINTSKSKCVHFRQGNAAVSKFSFKIGDNILETVEKYKYLGVIFQEKNNFSLNCEALAKGGGRALGSIISKIHNLKDFGFSSYEKLYNSCVVPILDYCSSVWGFKQYQTIDNIQHRALRYFLGVHRFTPILAMYGDSGWIPCIYRRWGNSLRLWNRLINMDDSRLTKQVFNYDYNVCKNNWCSDVKQIFEQLNQTAVFHSKSTVNLAITKQMITAYYASKWSRDIQTVSKLKFYRLLKGEFTCENYVTLNLMKSERSTMCQLRSGILPLRIETGRYIGEPAEQRLCRFCPQNSVENETHFTLYCNLYDELRQNTFGEIITNTQYTGLNDSEKLKVLFNSTRKCAKFINKAYNLRRSVVYS